MHFSPTRWSDHICATIPVDFFSSTSAFFSFSSSFLRFSISRALSCTRTSFSWDSFSWAVKRFDNLLIAEISSALFCDSFSWAWKHNQHYRWHTWSIAAQDKHLDFGYWPNHSGLTQELKMDVLLHHHCSSSSLPASSILHIMNRTDGHLNINIFRDKGQTTTITNIHHRAAVCRW